MQDYYKFLKRWKPGFLQAYPTPLGIFADYLIENNLSLKIPGISVTAEPLFPAQRKKISRAFGTIPFNWYGAREVGRIATECLHHKGMHVNSYGLYVEVDVSKGQFLPVDLGPIVITDLWNLGMPIIRYKIGDLGTINSHKCDCGSELPRIMSLEGRTTDILVNSSGQKIPGVTFTNRIVTSDQEFKELQFIQEEIGRFHVFAVPGNLWRGKESKLFIQAKVSEFMREPTEVKISVVESISREPTGKVRFCWSKLPNSE